MDTQLSKGTILQNGKYQIEKVLGQGGFGITYLARQEILEREVCIKSSLCGISVTGQRLIHLSRWAQQPIKN